MIASFSRPRSLSLSLSCATSQRPSMSVGRVFVLLLLFYFPHLNGDQVGCVFFFRDMSSERMDKVR